MEKPALLASASLQHIPWQNLHVKELVGNGSYGDVYQGQWHGVDVAIKQLHLKKLPEHLAIDFEREANIMAQCQFPFITRLYGVCMEAGHFAMVMEYLPQGSLYQRLHKSSDLPWEERWQLAIEMGQALSYLHAKDILHRDLKSMNILLDAQGHAKITDFGLSKVKLESSVSTDATKAVGTVRWRSPELFKRKAVATKASDIYSYGMILWELATRQLPFRDAPDEITAMGWIKDGEQEDIPADCPTAYADIIKQCWLAPEQRPSAEAIVMALEAARPQAAPLTVPEKAWHFEAALKQNLTVEKGKAYALLPASGKDVQKVIQAYQRHGVPGYDVGAVKVIYNPGFNRSFALHMEKLQHRQDNPAFTPKWSQENEPQQRAKTDELFRQTASPYTDSDYPHVKLLPLWHGTQQPAVFESICKTGYANLATTDEGFFGKGIYTTDAAEYSYRVYGKTLLLNWVAVYSAYPVIYGDRPKLQGKGNYQNYDAHFVPVAPQNPADPNETVYFPCKPHQAYQYIELVTFESASCLPRYVVELQATLLKQPKAMVHTGQENPPVEEKLAQLKLAPSTSNNQASFFYSAPAKLSTVISMSANKQMSDTPLAVAHNSVTKDLACDIPQLKSLAEQHNVHAQALLGWAYLWGIGIPKNQTEAEKWLQLAAKQKDTVPGQWAKGLCYQNGIGKPENMQRAIEYYRNAAEQGNYALSQTSLGICYDFGRGVTKDAQRAAYWYRKAAEQGDAIAQFNLGSCYTNGLGVAKDDQQAVYWYQKAAEQGYAKAQFSLGVRYANGQGVGKDYQQTVLWFQKAAEQGHTRAQFSLGVRYANGQGVVKDDQQAAQWYEKAAEQDLAEAQFNLGVHYANGQGVVKDDQQAVYWYQKAAKQGLAEAQFNLGVHYDNGQGIAKDDQQAVYWYQKAAKQGNAKAQFNLGVHYANGQGVGKDEKQAFYWYQKAAERGYANAQFSLGVHYANGQGVGKDEKQASYWYQKAAEQGYANAQFSLGVCYANGRGVAKNDQQAVLWFQKAAEQGLAKAQFNLGWYYANGQGATKDDQQAVYWYQKAAEQGHQDAKAALEQSKQVNQPAFRF